MPSLRKICPITMMQTCHSHLGTRIDEVRNLKVGPQDSCCFLIAHSICDIKPMNHPPPTTLLTNHKRTIRPSHHLDHTSSLLVRASARKGSEQIYDKRTNLATT